MDDVVMITTNLRNNRNHSQCLVTVPCTMYRGTNSVRFILLSPGSNYSYIQSDH
jgi:hypothetical protein